MAHGWGVDRLVPGDPDGIRVLAGSVAQYAAVTADAAAGLGRLDPQWTGAAYERFWESLIGHRQGFIEASVAFDAAGVALEVYAAGLDAARVEARTAGVWWEQGMDAAREHAMVEFLAGRSVSPPVTGGGSVGLVFSPAGAGLRADAVAKLDGAWADGSGCPGGDRCVGDGSGQGPSGAALVGHRCPELHRFVRHRRQSGET